MPRAKTDLHARQMYVCVMDRQGKKLVHCNVNDNDFDYFLRLMPGDTLFGKRQSNKLDFFPLIRHGKR